MIGRWEGGGEAMRRPFDRAKAQTVNRGVFFEGIVSGIGGLIPGLTPPNDKGLKMHKNRPTISGLPKSTTPNFSGYAPVSI